MARKIHIVRSEEQEYRKTRHTIHAAFSRISDANAFEAKLNADQHEDEPKAWVDSVVLCGLDGKWIEDKICYKVLLIQHGLANFGKSYIDVCPFLTTGATYTRDADQFTWSGWARSPGDALKRAKQAAMSSWVTP